MPLQDGLYDLLLTEGLERLLSRAPDARADVQILSGDASDYVVDSLVRQLSSLLDGLPGDDADQAARQLALVNELLVWQRQRLRQPTDPRGGDASAAVDQG